MCATNSFLGKIRQLKYLIVYRATGKARNDNYTVQTENIILLVKQRPGHFLPYFKAIDFILAGLRCGSSANFNFVMMRHVYLPIIVLLLIGCDADKRSLPHNLKNRSGVLVDTFQAIEKGDTFFTGGSRIYFDDSLFVEAIGVLKSVTDSDRITREWKEILYYRFSNLKTDQFLHFYNFADTAVPFYIGNYRDTTQLLGGFNFKIKKELIPLAPVQRLSDTTIHGIKHGAFSVVSKKRNGTFRFVCYYRYDKNGLPLTKVSNLDSVTGGQPVVKIDSYSIGEDQSQIGSSELVFERDSLTNQEKSILKIWQSHLMQRTPKTDQ